MCFSVPCAQASLREQTLPSWTGQVRQTRDSVWRRGTVGERSTNLAGAEQAVMGGLLL